MSENSIPKNVIAHLQECSAMVGRYEDDEFSYVTGIHLNDILSPIEQLFYTSICAVRRISGCSYLNDEKWSEGQVRKILKALKGRPPVGTCVQAQYKIGGFKVDFLVAMDKTPAPDPESIFDDKLSLTDVASMVVVELDGHDWHDRSESDRRYEKQRDRFIQEQGYKIIRFTGSELVEDPLKVACEAMAAVSIRPIELFVAAVSKYKA